MQHDLRDGMMVVGKGELPFYGDTLGKTWSSDHMSYGKHFLIIILSPQSSHDVEGNYYRHLTEEESESWRICMPIPGAEQRYEPRISASPRLPTAFPLAVCTIGWWCLFSSLYVSIFSLISMSYCNNQKKK